MAALVRRTIAFNANSDFDSIDLIYIL